MAYDVTKYPEYAGSTAIAGKKFLLYIAHDGKWNLLGGLRDTGIEISADSIDATNKGDGEGGLGWGESIAGVRSWSSTPSIVMKSSNAGYQIIEDWVLNEELQDARPALHVCFVNKQTKDFYHSWCQVTSFTIDASYDGIMTASIGLAGKGAVVKGANFEAETGGSGDSATTINPAVANG